MCAVWKILALLLVPLAIGAFIGVAGAGYGTYHAVAHGYRTAEQSQPRILVHGPSVMVLPDIYPYYLNQVDLIEDISGADIPSKIDFALVDTDCDHLNSSFSETNLTSTNALYVEHVTGLYLLPGSQMSFNICSMTSANRADVWGDIVLYLHILDNLETAYDFDPYPYPPSKSFEACFTNDKCSCQTYHYDVTRRGYYSLRFILNQPEFSQTMTYNYTITLNTTELVMPNSSHQLTCSVSENQPLCVFLLNGTSHSPHLMNKEQCVVVQIDGPKSHYTHIKETFQPYHIDWLVLSSVFIAACGVIVIVVVIVEIVVVRRIRKNTVT